MIDQNKQKAPTSADVKTYIKMMGAVTYGDQLEILRLISDPDNSEDVKRIKDFEELVEKIGADTPVHDEAETNKQSEVKI